MEHNKAPRFLWRSIFRWTRSSDRQKHKRQFTKRYADGRQRRARYPHNKGGQNEER